MQSVGNRAIAVDGKVYDVTKTTVKKPGVFTFAPVKGEAVYVDGKKYYVEKAPDFMANDKTKDAIEALQVLGYARRDIDVALARINTEGLTVEEIIKQGLKQLGM